MSVVLARRAAGVLWLTLNRPEALNALTNECLRLLHEELRAALEETTVRAIVLKGQGPKAFSAGIDLAEREPMTAAQKGDQSRRVLELVTDLHAAPKPVVASIGGWCLGAGLELALACDLRVVADDARFGFPEMKLGTYPGGGGAVLLPRIVGAARALEWLLSGRRIDASEALAIGLATKVIPRAGLDATTAELAEAIAGMAPLAVAALKRSIRTTVDMRFDVAIEADQRLRRPLDATQDHAEGLRAHRERRVPIFTGT